MDFSGRIFLAALEEDDEQRSLFRVRPLVDENGLINPEELELIGDEGYLRIVPDRQEQYTFKERLRLLGPVCLVDLKHIAPDLMKVRENKNYAPSRGEMQRYVLYSDTVHAIHSQPVYEVVSNLDIVEPLTRGYYLRKGGNIQGPYDRDTGDLLDGLSCIAPDSDKLFAVELSDGTEHIFFWPRVVPGQAALQRRPENAVPPPAYEDIGWTTGARLQPQEYPAPATIDQGAPIHDAIEQADTQEQLGPKQAAQALQDALTRSGFVCSVDDAMHLLLCTVLLGRVGVHAPHQADALLAARILSDMVGAQVVQNNASKGVQVLLPLDKYTDKQAGNTALWPVLRLETRRGFELETPLPQAAPLRPAALRQQLEAQVQALPEDILQRLNQEEQAVQFSLLPLTLKHDMLWFLRSAQAQLEGGAEAALSYALASMLQPFLAQTSPQDTPSDPS